MTMHPHNVGNISIPGFSYRPNNKIQIVSPRSTHDPIQQEFSPVQLTLFQSIAISLTIFIAINQYICRINKNLVMHKT